MGAPFVRPPRNCNQLEIFCWWIFSMAMQVCGCLTPIVEPRAPDSAGSRMLI